METGMYAPGTAEKASFENPKEHTRFSQDYNAQAVMPTDESTMRYFYSLAIPNEQPIQSLDFVFNMSQKAFDTNYL